MKVFITGILLVYFAGSFAQIKQKSVEKSDGTYTYCYHSNGKESTVQFWSLETSYGVRGYSKAYDKNGVLIYEAESSRSALICGTSFSYYDNGAIRSADYSAHPDAGIQWYRRTVQFDENGVKTGESEQRHDDHVTLLHSPDSIYRKQKNTPTYEEINQEKRNKERVQFIADSTAFFKADTIVSVDGIITIVKPNPAGLSRETISTDKGKTTKSQTEFFQQKDGILSVTRTFYKNGRVHEEWVIEAKVSHYRSYDKKGKMVIENLNQKR